MGSVNLSGYFEPMEFRYMYQGFTGNPCGLLGFKPTWHECVNCSK